MWFWLFLRACRKYKFTYSLYSYHGLVLDLRPSNTFEDIHLKEDYCNKNYNKLFKKAITEMKRYNSK